MNNSHRRIYDDVPAVSDPRWAAWTLSLYDFLSAERSWDELESWYALHRNELKQPLVQLVAYLSYSGLACSHKDGWVSCRQLPAEVSPLQVSSSTPHTEVVAPFERQLSRRKGNNHERA